MEGGGQEGLEQQAKRIVLVVRIVFYGALALIAVALIAARTGGDDPPVRLHGTTEQGAQVMVELVDGKAALFEVGVTMKCPGADDWPLVWRPGDGDPEPFERSGERVRVSVTTHPRYPGWSSNRTYELDAWVSERHVDGVVSAVQYFMPHDGGPAGTCDSGPVTFKAER